MPLSELRSRLVELLATLSAEAPRPAVHVQLIDERRFFGVPEVVGTGVLPVLVLADENQQVVVPVDRVHTIEAR